MLIVTRCEMRICRMGIWMRICARTACAILRKLQRDALSAMERCLLSNRRPAEFRAHLKCSRDANGKFSPRCGLILYEPLRNNNVSKGLQRFDTVAEDLEHGEEWDREQSPWHTPNCVPEKQRYNHQHRV